MQGLETFLSQFGVPETLATNRLFQAAVVVVLSILAAKIADWVISRMITRWARKTVTDLDDRILEMLHRPLFLFVLLGGLALAADLLQLEGGLQKITFGVLGTIAVFTASSLVMRVSRLALEALGQRGDRSRFFDERTLPLFRNLSNVMLLGVAAYFLFLVWGLDVTAWLASAGIIGIAVGFGAQDTVANFFAGVFILADAPYKIGDFIVLDSGERGQVTHIGLRSTRLLTQDDIEVTVPNAVMGNTKIVNETGGPTQKARIRIKVECAYGSDIDQVKQVLLDIAIHHDGVCVDPEPRVRFRVFGASGLALELLCWIDEPVLRGMITDALNTEVYRRFNEEQIEIPYAKQDLYVKEMPRGG
jgi:small-conductance mechanosensitive channel